MSRKSELKPTDKCIFDIFSLLWKKTEAKQPQNSKLTGAVLLFRFILTWLKSYNSILTHKSSPGGQCLKIRWQSSTLKAALINITLHVPLMWSILVSFCLLFLFVFFQPKTLLLFYSRDSDPPHLELHQAAVLKQKRESDRRTSFYWSL